MISLKAFDNYKKSKNLFIKKIPDHWHEHRLAHVAKTKSIINNEEEELLSVFLDKGVIKYNETNNIQVHKPSESLAKYQLVEKGDFVLNNQQAWRGSVGVSKYRGIVSPAYYIFELSDGINSSYANYLFRNSAMVDQYVLSSKGVGSIQRNLYYPYLRNAIVSLPPKKEQDQIVRFLDSKLLKINKFIKNKKKLIELLKEKKQTIINQAVTRGLDPNAKMKASGVEWLGDVPEGWEVRPIKSILRNISVTTKNGTPGQVYIGLENVESWTGKIRSMSSATTFEGQAKMFGVGDILLGKLRPYLAKVTSPNFSGFCSGEFLVLRPNRTLVKNRFVEHLIRSKTIIDLINKSTYGAKMPRGEWGFIGTIKIGMPDTEEQQKIFSYLETQTQTIDKTIDRITKEISLITEYHTALVSAVVTGQVDVRDVHIEEPQEVLEEQLEAVNEELPVDEEIPESEAI